MEWFGSEGSLKVIPFPALGRFTFTVPGCSSVQPGRGMGSGGSHVWQHQGRKGATCLSITAELDYSLVFLSQVLHPTLHHPTEMFRKGPRVELPRKAGAQGITSGRAGAGVGQERQEAAGEGRGRNSLLQHPCGHQPCTPAPGQAAELGLGQRGQNLCQPEGRQGWFKQPLLSLLLPETFEKEA